MLPYCPRETLLLDQYHEAINAYFRAVEDLVAHIGSGDFGAAKRVTDLARWHLRRSGTILNSTAPSTAAKPIREGVWRHLREHTQGSHSPLI